MTKKSKNIINLVAVLLLILSVASSSFLSQERKVAEKVKTEKQATKQENQKEVIKPAVFVAIVSFFHVDLIQDLYLIFNLNFVEILPQETQFKEPSFISSYFKNLFCFVISPNAP